MTKIAFKPLRHGRNLKVIAFPLPGGEALLEQTYPFDGAAIQDDENAPIITPDNRTSDPLSIPEGTWNTRLPTGLTRGGFVLEIDFEHEQIVLTPVSPRTKDPIKTKRMRYNFDMFGIVGDRTTPIQQVKSTIAYRVTAEKKPIKQTV